MAEASPSVRHDWKHANTFRVGVAVALGLLAGALDFVFGMRSIALLVCGDVGAAVYVAWVYLSALGQDGEGTRILATREDPGRVAVDLVVLLACLGALGAVAQVLIQSGHAKGLEQDLLAGVGAISVVCAWTLVHTIFMLRYARLFYSEPKGGVNFYNDEDPCYVDFAYLAFTVGMTFQVSDTDISKSSIRRAILHHALLSYLFGTVIVATTINLVAGLAK